MSLLRLLLTLSLPAHTDLFFSVLSFFFFLVWPTNFISIQSASSLPFPPMETMDVEGNAVMLPDAIKGKITLLFIVQRKMAEARRLGFVFTLFRQQYLIKNHLAGPPPTSYLGYPAIL